jgi:hypothetical protein
MLIPRQRLHCRRDPYIVAGKSIVIPRHCPSSANSIAQSKAPSIEGAIDGAGAGSFVG